MIAKNMVPAPALNGTLCILFDFFIHLKLWIKNVQFLYLLNKLISSYLSLQAENNKKVLSLYKIKEKYFIKECISPKSKSKHECRCFYIIAVYL